MATKRQTDVPMEDRVERDEEFFDDGAGDASAEQGDEGWSDEVTVKKRVEPAASSLAGPSNH